jgi:hypothetical protein
LLGKIGAGGLVTRIYDPISKRYVSRVNNVVTNKDATSVGGGSKTNAKVVSTDPEDDLNTGGVVMVREKDLTEAEARGRNLWTSLYAASFTATLNLVGLPELSDLEANEVITMNVLVPDAVAGGYSSHWSSGDYLVTEAIHEVSSSYSIACQLQRDSLSIGAESINLPGITQ